MADEPPFISAEIQERYDWLLEFAYDHQGPFDILPDWVTYPVLKKRGLLTGDWPHVMCPEAAPEEPR